MVEFTPKGHFSTHYTFRTAGHELVEVRSSAWRERAEFTLQSVRYRMYREKGWRGSFMIERQDGQLFASATKPSAFKDRFELDLGGRTFVMQRKSIWKSEFAIEEGGTQVGSVRQASVFSRRALVDVPADWPVQYQVFVFWLALLMWRRSQAAAAGA
ncbi:MAG TPA: hypothetical protein VGD27_17420 [Longimicrobiales bacterium]